MNTYNNTSGDSPALDRGIQWIGSTPASVW